MKQHFTFLMMILLAGVGFTLVSCQKDNSAQPTEAAESHRLDTQASSALDRINAFRESLEQSQSNPGAKDASCLSIDDAVWNVEALFNYTTIKHCTTAFYGVGLLVFNGSGHQRGRIEP